VLRHSQVVRVVALLVYRWTLLEPLKVSEAAAWAGQGERGSTPSAILRHSSDPHGAPNKSLTIALATRLPSLYT
jgi:hypothetical protein